MAVDQFRPEIWSAEILVSLRDKLVYGGLCNRNYEGEIQQAGDTVHITSIGDPAVRSYTEHGSAISWDQLSDTQQDLQITEADYFAFKVDDIEKAQALDGFIEEASSGAAYNLAVEVDTFVSGLMKTAADGSANDLGAKTVNSADSAYNLLVDLRTKMVANNVPDDGRFVVVPPEYYAYLLKDSRFIDASASGSTDALRRGFVGRAAGFEIFESNTVPVETTATWSVIAGHPMATTYADQILKTEALRLEGGFWDGVRGLHVYGAKVLRSSVLAMASVTVS